MLKKIVIVLASFVSITIKNGRYIMTQLAKKLHILKTGGSEQTAAIYTTEAECPAPNLKVNVDGTNGFIKLGNVTSPLATDGRVHINSSNTDYAILSSAAIRDFPNEWGAFQSIDFTATLTESGSDWCYAWVVHFANGVLPMRIGKDAAAPTRDDSLYISGSWPNVNSITWDFTTANTGWQASVARDASTALKWRDKSDNTTLSMKSYTDATIMGFNYGNNTVFITPFSATVSGNTLNIYKNGILFKIYGI